MLKWLVVVADHGVTVGNKPHVVGRFRIDKGSRYYLLPFMLEEVHLGKNQINVIFGVR